MNERIFCSVSREVEQDRILCEFKSLIDRQKKVCFVDDSKISDNEALGVLVATFFKWGCWDVGDTFCYALEDSNLHKVVADLRKIFKDEKGGKK